MEIQFLADCPEVIPALACLHQLEMKLGANSNYRKTVEKFYRRCNRNSLPLSLVAFVDTLPIGIASLIECDLPSHSHLKPWLASLFVATPYQRRGIGYQLMQQIESIATKIGYQQLYLYTWTAEKYYHQRG
jgi:predicted N-acetyltransferase YhbS